MEYVMFGNSGMKVSRLALGTMMFGSKLDLEASARVVDEALDHEINLIDTADSYGDSEEFLGRLLAPEKRDRVFLATKVFRQFCRDGKVARNSRTNIINSLERSLRLMRTDHVDLYQLHHPDDQASIEETVAALDVLVRQGKIRYVGVANHYAWQMAYMIGLAQGRGLEPIVSLQARYNVIDRQIEMESVPFCRRFNMAIMVFGPLCGGILTGKYTGPDGIPKGSRGEWHRGMQAYINDPTVRRIVDGLGQIAAENDLAMNQLAVLWLMTKPHATTILLGGSRPEHYTQIYDVAERELPQEVVNRVDELSGPRIYAPFGNQPIRDGAPLAEQR